MLKIDACAAAKHKIILSKHQNNVVDVFHVPLLLTLENCLGVFIVKFEQNFIKSIQKFDKRKILSKIGDISFDHLLQKCFNLFS